MLKPVIKEPTHYYFDNADRHADWNEKLGYLFLMPLHYTKGYAKVSVGPSIHYQEIAGKTSRIALFIFRILNCMGFTKIGTKLLNSSVSHQTEYEKIKSNHDFLRKVMATLPQPMVVDKPKTILSDLSQKTDAELSQVSPRKIMGVMKYCVELSERDSLSEEDKNLIKNFFKTFIQAIRNKDINEKHPIDNDFFKKMVNDGYNPNQLFAGKWRLQQIISSDLEVAMKAVKNADKNTHPKKMSELILTRSFHRGILAADLNGNRNKPAGGGVNGAVFFKHLEAGIKQPYALLSDETAYLPFLGVFKPHPKTVSEFKGWFDAAQWIERVKAVAGMESHLNQNDPDKRVNNEIFAYEMFHIFGFNSCIGFPTTLKFKNKNDKAGRPASFCAFIPGLDLVEAHVKSVNKDAKSNILNDEKKRFGQQELLLWQMSKLFDFLTGNMDGHEGNAFIKIENRKITAAVNFDYDKAFAVESTPMIGNQYKWAKLEISKHAFTKDTRKALSEMFKEGGDMLKIEAFLAKARHENRQNFSLDQEQLLRERVETLKKVAAGEIEKLSDFSDFKGMYKSSFPF